jgi:hypothetical protein
MFKISKILDRSDFLKKQIISNEPIIEIKPFNINSKHLDIAAADDSCNIASFDVWVIITQYLPAKELLKLTRVCRLLYIYITNDIILQQRLPKVLDAMATKILGQNYHDGLKKYFESLNFNPCTINTNKFDYEDYNNNDYLLELKKELNDQSYSNCYGLIKYWYSILKPMSYLNSSLHMTFAKTITALQNKNYSLLKSCMANEVWFTKPSNQYSVFIIKVFFSITDDISQLILNMSICNGIKFCKTPHCIDSFNCLTVFRELRSYLLKSFNSEMDITGRLPIEPLVNELFQNNKSTHDYFSTELRFDISQLNKLRHWSLLYEFIARVMYYKKPLKEIPKIYYGEFKNIKNDKVKQLFADLNTTAISLSKILKNFDNDGMHNNIVQNEASRCLQMHDYSEGDDNICDYCGSDHCDCERYA